MNYKYKCGNKTLKFDKIMEFKKDKDISVILPTYNEQECINRIIKAIGHILKGKNYEIIVVDDNSSDKTPEIIDSYNSNNIVALHRYTKRGILSAISDGVRAARSDAIIMMDADFSHPPNKIPEMLKYLNLYDIVSCSRFMKGGDVKAPFIQQYSTILLNHALKLVLFDLGITDFTGGFHAIKRDRFLNLNLRYNSVWGEFDMELFYKAKKKGFKIKEIPFVYEYREEGKSKSENYIKYLYYYWKMALKLRLFG